MKQIGDEGTEQFAIETYVDGQLIESQPIHDPFVHNTTIVGLSRWGHLKAIFRPRRIRVEVNVHGTEGAQRAIMTLDPEQLSRDTEAILEQRRIRRESSGAVGYEVERGGT